MVNDNELSTWRLSMVAELVWKVLPEQERAKPWEDVAVAAVYEYEHKIHEYQDGDDNFVLYSDKFINKQYIFNRRSDIRKYLEEEGRYISYTAGRGEGNIYRVTDDSQLDRLLTIRHNRMAGLVDSYNESLETIRKHKPQLAMDMLQFEQVKQIAANGN